MIIETKFDSFWTDQVENATVKSLSSIVASDFRMVHSFAMLAEPSSEEISTGTPHVPEFLRWGWVGYRQLNPRGRKTVSENHHRSDRREEKLRSKRGKVSRTISLNNTVYCLLFVKESVHGLLPVEEVESSPCAEFSGQARSEFAIRDPLVPKSDRGMKPTTTDLSESSSLS